MIDALKGGEQEINSIRLRFAAHDSEKNLLDVAQLGIDPRLLDVVLGPDGATRWCRPLETKYEVLRTEFATELREVERSWEDDEPRWRPARREEQPTGSAAAAIPPAEHADSFESLITVAAENRLSSTTWWLVTNHFLDTDPSQANQRGRELAYELYRRARCDEMDAGNGSPSPAVPDDAQQTADWLRDEVERVSRMIEAAELRSRKPPRPEGDPAIKPAPDRLNPSGRVRTSTIVRDLPGWKR